jgi:sporulation protein YlmC with PRC-barrel domain
MERAYREDELLDSIVLDSEGYIYGKVGKIDIKEDKISLLVYETKPDERTAVDIDFVREELLKGVKLPFTARLQRLSRSEVLARNIQEEFDLKQEEPLTDEHYIKYAERLGIEIPYKKIAEGRKEPKGNMTLNDVKTIGITTLGTGERSRVIKIILLNEPKEAEFRKIPVQKKVSYRDTKMIRDKLVVDSSGLAVGYTDSVVLFSDSPGIRVYSSKPTDSVRLSWLFLHLEKIGRPDIIEAIKKYFEIERGSYVYRVMMEDLKDFMRNTKITFKVPENLLLDRSVKEFLMDIPWGILHKVGDVVLLRTTLSKLKSEGY